MAIPQELYEAAEVDGATACAGSAISRFRCWQISISSARLLSTIWTLGDFNAVYLISGGGPAMSTEVLATLGIRYAFTLANPPLGVAAVMSALPLLIPVVACCSTNCARRTFSYEQHAAGARISVGRCRCQPVVAAALARRSAGLGTRLGDRLPRALCGGVPGVRRLSGRLSGSGWAATRRSTHGCSTIRATSTTVLNTLLLVGVGVNLKMFLAFLLSGFFMRKQPLDQGAAGAVHAALGACRRCPPSSRCTGC